MAEISVQTDFPTSSSHAGVGASLRRAREDRGLSIADVSRVTRIRPRYLDALEHDAPLKDFPAPVYARFFLSEYAGYLGLDKRSILADFDDGSHTALLPELRLVTEIETPRRWVGRVAKVGVAALVVGSLAVALAARTDRDAPDASEPLLRELVASADGRAKPPGLRAAPEHHRIDAVLSFDEPSWVLVLSDGREEASRVVEAGARLSFRAHRTLRIELGNGAGVRLRVNGARQATAAEDVTILRFVMDDGHLVRR